MSEQVTGPASYFPSIEAKYGQPVEHWLTELDNVAGKTHSEQVNWLKAEYGIGHGHANALVVVYRERTL
jgi:hypothetical protein